MKELKDLIKTRRLEIGKTLEEIGKEIGVAKATVQRWESGEIKDMRRNKLVALAKSLNVTPAYLMGWEEEGERTKLTDLEKSSLLQELGENEMLKQLCEEVLKLSDEGLKSALDYSRYLLEQEKEK